MTNRPLKHTLFWVLYLMIWIGMDVLNGISFNHAFYQYAGCLLEIPFYYLHMYVIWPKLLNRKKYIAYFLSLLLTVVLSSLLVLAYRYFLEFPILLDRPIKANSFFNLPSILRLARSILLWFGPPTVVKILMDWHIDKINLEILDREKKETELNFLKSQVNPHFLFNTLNNLYGLALNESKKTPDALMQLSHLLSYTIYEGAKKVIPLEQEIQHLNSYIELEKLRFGNRLSIKMAINGDLEGIMVTPLILLPLVENAFKHSSMNQRGEIIIYVSISIKDNELSIETINSKGDSLELPAKKGGVGLENIRKRLSIVYPNRHQLLLEEKESKFCVNLKINL